MFGSWTVVETIPLKSQARVKMKVSLNVKKGHESKHVLYQELRYTLDKFRILYDAAVRTKAEKVYVKNNVNVAYTWGCYL